MAERIPIGYVWPTAFKYTLCGTLSVSNPKGASFLFDRFLMPLKILHFAPSGALVKSQLLLSLKEQLIETHQAPVPGQRGRQLMLQGRNWRCVSNVGLPRKLPSDPVSRVGRGRGRKALHCTNGLFTPCCCVPGGTEKPSSYSSSLSPESASSQVNSYTHTLHLENKDKWLVSYGVQTLNS